MSYNLSKLYEFVERRDVLLLPLLGTAPLSIDVLKYGCIFSSVVSRASNVGIMTFAQSFLPTSLTRCAQIYRDVNRGFRTSSEVSNLSLWSLQLVNELHNIVKHKEFKNLFRNNLLLRCL